MILEKHIVKYEPIAHFLLWAAVLAYPYIKYLGKENGYQESFLHEINALVFIVITSYSCYFWFFKARKNPKNVLIIIVLFLLSALLFNILDKKFHPNNSIDSWKQVFSSIITYLTFVLLFYLLFITKKYIENQRLLLELDSENQEARLSVLNSKINPHFLYNTLNMIYCNAVDSNKNTSELILKLSDIFRYITDNNLSEVLVIEEVDYMQKYIELQELRLSKKVKVSFKFETDNEAYIIPSLLLIPFVENAFKFTSQLKNNNHTINIYLHIKNNVLRFHCQNPYSEEQILVNNNYKRKSVGIETTKRRLNLLYKNDYFFKIDTSNKIYTIDLKLKI